MASLYPRRGSWYIDYRINKKRFSLNTKLNNTVRNKLLAIRIKEDIEKEVEKLKYSPEQEEEILNSHINITYSNKNLKLSGAIESYKRRLKLRSQKHQKQFDIVINRLLEFVSIESPVREITPEHIIAFILSYKDMVANPTMITYINYLKGFFNYLIDEEVIERSPIRKKDLPRRERKSIVTFSEDLSSMILNEARSRDSTFYTILMMLNLTGIRPNDLFRLKVGNFDFDKNDINDKNIKD